MKSKLLRVARWEFIERVKTKSFIIGLFLTPTIMIAFAVLPSMLAMKEDEESRKIAVFDGTNMLFDSLRSKMNLQYKLKNGSPNYFLDKISGDEKNPAALIRGVDKRILDKSIEAAIIIPANAIDLPVIEYRGLNVSNIRDIDRIEKTISKVISEYQIHRAGLNPEQVNKLIKEASIRTVRITEKGESETGFLEQFGMAYFFIIMLMITILQSGQLLVRSLVEEKSNRLVEVLISSCSPTELMAGKILGLSGLGLLQLSLWTGIVVILLIVNKVTTVQFDILWLLFLYFILGYLLYAGLFVACGTLVSTEQEAQQTTGYLTILLVIPFIFAFFATQAPNAPIIKILSFIPLLTPTMMVLRIPILMPPLWEILLTLFILIVSVIGVMWAAGKIFRIGILITGKRPSLDEIVKWIRA